MPPQMNAIPIRIASDHNVRGRMDKTSIPYKTKMIPPITFPHVAFSRALAAGRERIASGIDPKLYAQALDLNSLAALQYTGGTTGVAKGAMLTHGNLVANTMQGLEMFKPFIKIGNEVILTALPLYHIFAFTANLMIFYLAGGRNVLVPSPRPPSRETGPSITSAAARSSVSASSVAVPSHVKQKSPQPGRAAGPRSVKLSRFQSSGTWKLILCDPAWAA